MFHLVRRFFGFLRAKPLSPDEQARVHRALTPQLRRLFFAQPPEDQRHAVEVLARIDTATPEVIEAALMHDVGKAASRIGAFQRSLATLAGLAHLPVRRRWRRYLDHGEIGAAWLADAGASDLTVAFARAHPGPAPPGVDEVAWSLLASADDA